MTRELVRTLPLSRIGSGALVFDVVATDAECAAVATRLMIPSIASLSCRFTLLADRSDTISAQGVLVARLTQVCVVTLDPFESELRDEFAIRFVPAERITDDSDPEDEDEIPYEGDVIDLGEAAVEQLALVLPAYPHAPGVAFDDIDEGSDGAEVPSLPQSFAALSRLRGPG